MDTSEIIKMGYVIQAFLEKEKLVDAKPKDLMPVLIEKGFFKKDHREGLPLREILRELDYRDELYLLPQVRADRKEKNVSWLFNAVIGFEPNKILEFQNFLKTDTFNRYQSWNHCYEVFGDISNDNDYLALHLGFYLASWGMYRGSAGLLQKDYKIHVGAVTIIKKYHSDLRCHKDFEISNESIDNIIELKKELYKHYDGFSYQTNKGTFERKSPTDTLLSKIVLGTLGCTPAFDRYFNDGTKIKSVKARKFDKKSLSELFKFIKVNNAEIKKIQDKMYEDEKVYYPVFKLVDMFFWNEGFKAKSN